MTASSIGCTVKGILFFLRLLRDSIIYWAGEIAAIHIVHKTPVIYYILYTIYYILYTIYYVLYTMYYILYTIYYILYTI